MRQRVAIVGRAALEDIGDEHVAALQADLAEQPVEQLPCLPDERKALPVLVSAGRLADEHQVGIGVARAEHDLRASLVKLAGDAHARLVVDGFQKLPPDTWAPHPVDGK